MNYDKDLVAAKLVRWETYLRKYRLPEWDDIPDIGLYMEQLIRLMKNYLDYLPPELKEEQFITPATINNYVRKKIIPEPIQKKYYRVHIAYLIMICTLKHCLSIPTLQTLIPMGLREDALRTSYSSYVNRHRLAIEHFIFSSQQLAAGILGTSEISALAASNTEELITTAAVISGFSRLLAEKLLLLNSRTMDSVAEEERLHN